MRLILFIVVLALGLLQCKDFTSPNIDVICHPGLCKDTLDHDPEAQKILDDANIFIQKDTLSKEDSIAVNDEINRRLNISDLIGRSNNEIFLMYSDFLSKYDSNDKIDIANNRQWNDDPFFQAMYKDPLWTEKVDSVKESIFEK